MTYEYEIWQDDSFQAGGSAPNAVVCLQEADHYAMMYGQDGPAEVLFYTKNSITREELEADLARDAGRLTETKPPLTKDQINELRLLLGEMLDKHSN